MSRRPKRFFQKHPRLSALAFGCFTAAALVAALEIACALTEKKGPSHDAVKTDSPTGYRTVYKIGGKLIYDFKVTLDEFQRRVVPLESQKAVSKHLVFLGCSYTFGEGVNDEETLPFFAGRKAPRHRVYNYAMPGTGPESTLEMLRSRNIGNEIKEHDGVAVFVFMDDHLNRALGGLPWYRHDRPNFELTSDGSLVRNGTHLSAHPLRTLAYDIARRSRIFSRFGLTLPFWYSNTDFRLFARMIKEIETLMKTKAGTKEFYFVVYPEYSQYLPRLIPYLEEFGVKYLDYSAGVAAKLEKTLGDKARFSADPHPTGAANRFLASELISSLKL